MSIYVIAFIVLMIAWVCAWIVFHVTGGLIHILLVAAVVSLILHFFRGRHAEPDVRINR
jgi:F0F1-type ATP synthase assembly protein I